MGTVLCLGYEKSMTVLLLKSHVSVVGDERGDWMVPFRTFSFLVVHFVMSDWGCVVRQVRQICQICQICHHCEQVLPVSSVHKFQCFSFNNVVLFLKFPLVSNRTLARDLPLSVLPHWQKWRPVEKTS